LLAEVETLRQRVAALEQAKHDLEVRLEMATDHADDLSETLQQERDDLETVLEITMDHGDLNEAHLQSQAEALARRNQFIRETFGRYVSEAVVAQLLDAPEGFELGGAKRQATSLMSDVRGFTALAECLAPQEVMTVINRYLEAMVDVILAYQGTIIEMLGDGLLVLFGAPLNRDDDAERAVACALAMQLRLEATNAPNRRAGLPEVEMGIGIHTGEVVVGHIGSQQRTKYGVVGSAVNLTGRIESYTTGGQILISPTTYAETAAILTVSHQLTVAPKGIAAPITLYAVSCHMDTFFHLGGS
jgi:adenylate cyclase